MKTHLDRVSVARRPFWGAALVVLATVGFTGLPLLRAADAVETPKDHALFVGGDVCVEFRGASREVIAATQDAITVRVDGVPVVVTMADVKSVRVERSLKLSDVIAQIGDFKATPVHHRSDAASPQWAERWMAMSGVRDLAVTLNDKAVTAQANSYVRMQSSQGGMSAASATQNWQNASQAASSASQSMMAASSAMNSFTETADSGEIDALEVSCTIAAPKAAREGFLLLVTGYQERKDGALQYQIHLEPVKDLGPKARHIEFVQTGLPAGYILKGNSVHLFAAGLEIASNLSEKRVDLSADDALLYLVMSYVVSHPKESLAASPLRIAFPADFKTRATGMTLAQPLYATIGTDGMVCKLATDAAGNGAVDPYLDTVVRKFRFNPALKEGKAIESVVELKLSDYIR